MRPRDHSPTPAARAKVQVIALTRILIVQIKPRPRECRRCRGGTNRRPIAGRGRGTRAHPVRGRDDRARAHPILLIPQFCPHRPGTVVEQQGMETCERSISRTAVHIGPDRYRMCPYGPRSHIRRLRFSALFCVSPRKSRYRNDCGQVAPLTRIGTEENLKKKKNIESARNWPLESQ